MQETSSHITLVRCKMSLSFCFRHYLRGFWLLWLVDWSRYIVECSISAHFFTFFLPYAELITSGARNFSHITIVLLQNVSTPIWSEENHGWDMGGRQVASHAILGGWPRRMDYLCWSQSSGASDNVEAKDGGDTQVLDRQGGQLLEATEMKISTRKIPSASPS